MKPLLAATHVGILMRAEVSEGTGMATASFWGPGSNSTSSNQPLPSIRRVTPVYYYIDSDGDPEFGTEAAHEPRGVTPDEGYFPVPPVDKLQDLTLKWWLRSSPPAWMSGAPSRG